MAGMIQVDGQVVHASTGDALAQATVIAWQEGTEIQQRTDGEGRFAFQLVPGQWRITARCAGFNEPEAYFANLDSDTAALDFKLQEGYLISGLVIRENARELAAGVVVAARAEIDGRVRLEQDLTDVHGKFRIVGLPAGRWKLQGTQGESQTEEVVLDLQRDAYNVNLTISRQMTRIDWLSGRAFFAALGAVLLALVAIYVWAHARYVPAPEPELIGLIAQVDQALRIAAASEVTQTAQGAPSTTGIDPTAGEHLATLRTAIAGLEGSWTAVSGGLRSVSPGQNEQVKQLLMQAETAIAAKNPEDVLLALNNIKSVLASQQSVYFWSTPPSSYLEVLFWSLAGILVSLLVTSGYYLRRKRFYVEGIWMHLSHLLAVPFLALVVVFLVSQVKLTVQVDDSALALDITDPRLLAALSFIIAARPWGMIDFVRETSGSIFGLLRRRLTPSGEGRVQPDPSAPAAP